MTQSEILAMAAGACSPHQVLNTDLEFLERFAALVAAHEREKQTELNQLEKSLCNFWKPQKEETESLMFTYEQVKAHIQAARINERAACAKVCEEYDMDHVVGQQLAAAIRARSEK